LEADLEKALASDPRNCKKRSGDAIVAPFAKKRVGFFGYVYRMIRHLKATVHRKNQTGSIKLLTLGSRTCRLGPDN